MFNEHGSFTSTWDNNPWGDKYTYTETPEGLQVEIKRYENWYTVWSLWPNGVKKTWGNEDTLITTAPDNHPISSEYKSMPEKSSFSYVYELTWIDGV